MFSANDGTLRASDIFRGPLPRGTPGFHPDQKRQGKSLPFSHPPAGLCYRPDPRRQGCMRRNAPLPGPAVCHCDARHIFKARTESSRRRGRMLSQSFGTRISSGALEHQLPALSGIFSIIANHYTDADIVKAANGEAAAAFQISLPVEVACMNLAVFHQDLPVTPDHKRGILRIFYAFRKSGDHDAHGKALPRPPENAGSVRFPL